MPSTQERPTQPRDYGAVNAVWSALVGGLLAAAKVRSREAPSAAELPVLGLATFAMTKALSKEKVGTWLRSPLVEHEPDGEQPKGSGLRFVAGELLTCPRCLGAWTSVAIVGLRVISPREGRIVASLLATSAINDGLQASFSYLCARSNAAGAAAHVGEAEARAADARLACLEAAQATAAERPAMPAETRRQ
jgi:hypothetical protein